jgi:cobalt-zinc-cadmium efflux system outer membrane protein
MNNLIRTITILALAIAMLAAMSGCKGVSTHGEREARADVTSISKKLVANAPDVSTLTTNSGLKDFLRFAMLNHPQVQAAFYDWSAAVEKITVERSLPDPKLTFQAYITDMLTSLMPGLAMDFPGPGKLAARANEASAESHAKYFQFESAVLQTAFDVKKTFYPLHFLDEKIRVNRRTLALIGELEKIARAQNEVGSATLQDVLRTEIEAEKLRTETATLEDSRRLLMPQFKAALGLTAHEPDPPLPKFETTELNLSDDELFATALARNPKLKEMEAEIRMAEASIRTARKEKTPDFSGGVMAEVYTPPFYWPQASMSLPIWRDKIAAEIAGAQNQKRAAQARLNAGQISVAVDFAEKTFMVREAIRQLASIREQLLPRAQRSLEISRAAYLSGQLEFMNVIEAERMLLDLQLDEIAMKTQREVALAELSLVVAGIAPNDAPILKAADEHR